MSNLIFISLHYLRHFTHDSFFDNNNVGRLWAALIQLCHADGELYQTNILKYALQAVPKSGEVWCEGEVGLLPFCTKLRAVC